MNATLGPVRVGIALSNLQRPALSFRYLTRDCPVLTISPGLNLRSPCMTRSTLR